MILVTGASGHTGRRVVQRLLEQGKPVRVMTRQPTRIPKPLRPKVEMFRGSLSEPTDAADGFAGCSAVIAMTHIRFADKVIAAMKIAGVRRCIFMSSTRRYTNFPEETARAVIAGEQAVRDSSLDWTIIRPTMIYGGEQDNNLTHLVNALRHFPFHPLGLVSRLAPGGGKMLFQPVFTWDVVQAITAALERPESIGKEYIVAGPGPIAYRDMVGTILRGLGKPAILIPVPLAPIRAATRLYGLLSKNPRIRMDQIQRLEEDKTFDISEARRDLEFDPISFQEGIRRKLAGEV